MPSVGTWWRTLRHLRYQQFAGRVRFKLSRPQADLAPAPPRRVWPGDWVQPAARQPSLVSPRRFRFLNQEADLNDIGWSGEGPEKLWRYNQHYFDDLNAQRGRVRQPWHLALIEDWILTNPPAGGDGWEPYPTSLRIVNWIKAAASGLPLPAPAIHSLAIQARWLTQRMEWHLLGNHLFANAKALVFAGLFFEGEEAEAWLRQGLDILAHELPEQVLADGGQFERSPMYHALALEDLLDLINVTAAQGHGPHNAQLHSWREVAGRMHTWLLTLSHPDGHLAQFNDSAHGIAPDTEEITRYAHSLGVGRKPLTSTVPRHLDTSGYLRVDWSGAALFCDMAPIGPDYLPGHAHADTLSFEWSIGRRRVIVNGGTSRYGSGPQRLQERGTAAHSTVQVAGQNSSEVWSGFRAGRRAYPFDVAIAENEASASHDGYTWMPGRPVHSRTWCWAPHQLTVRDRVTGPHAAQARYHLAPGLRFGAIGDRAWEVAGEAGRICVVRLASGRGAIAPSRQSPEFGLTHETQCLVVELDQGLAETLWQW